MILSVQQIKYELLAYMKEFGGDFHEWYVGIADDAPATLSGTHLVDPATGLWIYKQALTPQAARTVQEYFMSTLGTDGSRPVAFDEALDCVYAFRKSTATRAARPGMTQTEPQFGGAVR